MRYVLGIDIGSTSTCAAVSRCQAGRWSRPEPLRLDGRDESIPSVLHLAPDGTVTVGDHRAHLREPDPTRVARGFSRRVGDEVPYVLGGEPYSPQALTAALALWVVERALAREGAPPEQIVLSHPGSWGPYRQQLLHRALWEVGLGGVTLLPEAVTAAESHGAAEGEEPAPLAAGPLAVYALGGGGFEASVVRRSPHHPGFELVSAHAPAEPFGGEDLDDALVGHVRARLGRELDALSPTDPRTGAVLTVLREECARARQDLSVAPEADVLVQLPHRVAQLRVTRAEFEELVRPALRATVETLTRTVAACGLRPEQLAGVLLVGGAARTPLVAELLSARFPGRVAVQPDPRVTAATGAAAAAIKIVSGWTRPEPEPQPDLARRVPEPPWPDDDQGDGPGVPPPPRPPIKITPLRLPRARSVARLLPGRGDRNLDRPLRPA